jgi:transcriptional regulator with XRE-family HTH domain
MVVITTMIRNDALLKFGREIRRRREALGLTLAQFAERCGLTQNFIGTIENGYRDPSLSTMLALAKGFGIPLGALVESVPGMSPAAVEMAKLLDDATEAIREAIMELLRSIGKKPRR